MAKAKRNPQDATLRNIRALKTRMTVVEHTIDELLKIIAVLAKRVAKR